MYAPRATGVTASPSQAPRRLASPTSFASALRVGLADLAYSFEGVFRPVGAMSLAERASYGLWPPVRSPKLSTEISPPHVFLNSAPACRSTSGDPTLRTCRLPAERDAIASTGKRPASNGERIREEARLRRVSASDTKAHVSDRSTTRHHGTRIRAKIGKSAIDVIVHSGMPLPRVMLWTR